MLMLVMSNNFLQLFFGWEAVGLVSYLLIGFWYTRPTAIFANMKAFLVNRVGDFGFILGIGLVLAYTGSLNYAEVFGKAGEMAKLTFPGSDWLLITVTCICLFIGAMGKSAQFPLHVWLPDSMEGPTPISALIHAAIGVGPSIESGSHTCNGTCADLPIAPTNSSRQITVGSAHCWPGMISIVSPERAGAAAKASAYESEPT